MGSGLLEVELGWLVGKEERRAEAGRPGPREAKQIPGHHGPGCRETGLRPASPLTPGEDRGQPQAGAPPTAVGHDPSSGGTTATWPRRSGRG